MESPASRLGKTYGKQKKDLTLFGRWIEEINSCCGINQAELALRLGITKSNMSKFTRGQRQMNRNMIRKLIHLYEEIIAEKQIPLLPNCWQQSLFLAWSEDESLVKELPVMLDELTEMRRNAMS